MFPSPQERQALNQLHRDLLSGSSPKQFGLEMQRNQEIIDQASAIGASGGRANLWPTLINKRRLISRAKAALATMWLTPKLR
jgi:hypothetical protein